MSARMTARVGLLFGDEALIRTDYTGDGEPERVPVDRLVADTGIPREQLPGTEVIAVVGDDGQMERFERA
ncbi:hypothetical protein ABZ468_25815 [Streptomyces sp. NPDC005708]|uniref:hypothetical protein n=1 Tax=Streptomyces sp. NPDC005708 TaxID=3154564 RepID=UPI0033D3D66C